ncbi:hypothetical protein [Ligilactobacillus agilis]|uniref:hypothetical protein n=1 Tax=Ligilactobacillus agilis TaxID=1601 RepID=UPI003F8B2B28
MTNEERLKKQLDRNWLSLSRIVNTAMNLDNSLDEGAIDTEFAFTALLEFVKQEYLNNTVDCLKIEEETDND